MLVARQEGKEVQILPKSIRHIVDDIEKNLTEPKPHESIVIPLPIEPIDVGQRQLKCMQYGAAVRPSERLVQMNRNPINASIIRSQPLEALVFEATM